MKELCKALDRLAIIYQIPNYDPTINSILLAEWILDTYKHEDYDLVRESLKNPVRLNDHTWRLTPDSISGWIDYTRIKRANQKEIEESRKRQEAENQTHKYSPETEAMIQEFKNKLLEGVKPVPQISDEDIKANGQLRPQAVKRASTNKEYLIEKQLRKQWALEVHDKYTGKRLDNWISFEEYIKL